MRSWCTWATAPFAIAVLADLTGPSREPAEPLFHRAFRKLDPGGFSSLRATIPADPSTEAAWAGVQHLLRSVGAEGLVQVSVYDASLRQIARDLTRHKNDLANSAMAGELGSRILADTGNPFSLLIVDQAFSHEDASGVLFPLAQLAASIHVPMVAAASTNLFAASSVEELVRRPTLAPMFRAPPYAAWRSLRSAQEARYLSLALPRVWLPTSSSGTPVLANGAYAVAAMLAEVFRITGEIPASSDRLAMTDEPRSECPLLGRQRELADLGVLALDTSDGAGPRVAFASTMFDAGSSQAISLTEILRLERTASNARQPMTFAFDTNLSIEEIESNLKDVSWEWKRVDSDMLGLYSVTYIKLETGETCRVRLIEDDGRLVLTIGDPAMVEHVLAIVVPAADARNVRPRQSID